MWRKYKNWMELIRFIQKHRKENRPQFTIHTTLDEVIIVEVGTRDQIRINQKLYLQ